MKLLFTCVVVFACAGLAQQGPAASAQQGRGGAGARSVGSNPRSNEQNGVDPDRFIGYPSNSPVHLSHATLLTHSILTAGDPYAPGPRGAVLEYKKELSTATLLPRNRTPLLTLEDQFLFYIQDGEGRLDDGKQSWDLREGLAILIPPNAPRRFINTSDKPLNMIMARWAPAGTPKKDILVRDVNLLPYCEENAHWHNTTKCIFGVNDGLMQGERVYVVMLQPWAMSQPHAHGPGTEEIWTKLTPGLATMLIGSDLREFPQNAAYLVPPNGVTEHANLNLTKDRVEWWLYIARGRGSQGQGNLQSGATPPNANPAAANATGATANQNPAATVNVNPANPNATAGAAGGNPNAGGARRNPNIIRDPASVEAATIAGKPLK